MKKIIYTLSFLATSCFVANAQNGQTQIVSTGQGSVGTLQQQEPAKQDPNSSLSGKKGESPAPKGTRMAINEKGVPASKETKSTTSSEKDAKGAKTQKTASPGQPAATENNK